MKRTVVLFLAVILLTSLIVIPTSAANPDNDYAQALYSMGLFRGTGTDSNGNPVFDLERQPNRTEALVMMLRLFGEEAQALAYTGPMPFTDVPVWAAGYVGYAYSKGYTNGISSTQFGALSTANENAFVTFVLRALGYDDGAGDFSYASATDFAIGRGILDESLQNKVVFTRGDCTKVSYLALSANCKGTDISLLDKLITHGVVDSGYADTSDFLPDYFQSTQIGNASMGCNAATDGENIYIARKVEIDPKPNDYCDFYYNLYKFDSDLTQGEVIYTSKLTDGRITDLSIHDGKLYFFDGTPYKNGTRSVPKRYFDFVEMDLDTYETKILYSTGYLHMLGWADGTFYFDEDPVLNASSANYANRRIVSIDTGANNKVTFLPVPDSLKGGVTLFQDYGAYDGMIYVVCMQPKAAGNGLRRCFAKWTPKTGAIEVIDEMQDFQLIDDDIYFTKNGEDGDSENLKSLYHAKINDYPNCELVCTLPTLAWRLNYNFGYLYSTCDQNRVNGQNVVYKIDLKTGKYTQYITGFIDFYYNVINGYVISDYSIRDTKITDLSAGKITILHDFIDSRIK